MMTASIYSSNRTAVMAAVACSLHDMAEVYVVASRDAANAANFIVAMEMSKPQQITYGPQRKGKGGKVRKW